MSIPRGLLGYAPSDNSYRTVGQTLGALEGGVSDGSFNDAIDMGQMNGQQQVYDAQKAASTDGPFTFGLGPVSDVVGFAAGLLPNQFQPWARTIGYGAAAYSNYETAMGKMDGVSSILEEFNAFSGEGFGAVRTGILMDGTGTLASFGASAGLAVAGTFGFAWEVTSYTFDKVRYSDGQSIIDFYADEALNHGLVDKNNKVVNVNLGPFGTIKF